jgi:hypothetical protein
MGRAMLRRIRYWLYRMIHPKRCPVCRKLAGLSKARGMRTMCLACRAVEDGKILRAYVEFAIGFMDRTSTVTPTLRGERPKPMTAEELVPVDDYEQPKE